MRKSICSFLGEDVVFYDVCAFWFKRFKSGNFSLIDQQRPGGPRNCDNDDLEKLLAENSTQTQKELAVQLEVTQ